MRFFTIICLLVLFQFCSHSDANTNHYVDKNATGSNNGSSWANAWQSFSAIDWNSVEPGDIVYISGGTSSTVYYEQLKILNVDGTPENPITIRNSWDAGHNGRVIIDGGALDCIEIGDYGYEPSNLIFYGLETRGGEYGIFVHVAAINITIDSCYVYDWHNQGFHTAGTNDNPWNGPADIDGIIIQNSSFISATNYGGDAITFNRSSNHIVRNNYIHIRNAQQNNLHIDGTLGIRCEGFRFYNNVVILDSNAQGQAYIIRAWADGANKDSVIIYNNLFYQGGIWDSDDWPWTSTVNLRWQSEGSQVKPPTFVAHNTIISWGRYVQGTVHEVPATWVNNIIAMFGDGLYPATGNWLEAMKGSDAPPVDSVRNNLIWREFESRATRPMFTGTWDGNGTSAREFGWSTWVNILGGTGINANPLFVDDIGNIHGDDQANISGELQPNSPAINQGEDLQAIIEAMGLPWADINGNPRDNMPTIGAYEKFDNTNGNYIRVDEGWNYISIPKFNNSMIPDSLLPNRTSSVFEYNNGGYQIVNYLQNSKGYIVKFDHSDYIFVNGDSINTPIQVSEGWNLIGPFDKNVPIEQVNSVPPGIIISDFFEYYSNQFLSSSMLRIGRGYWVKVSSNGVLNLAINPLGKSGVELHTTKPNKDWGMIEINDNKGKSSTLYVAEEVIESGFYELPPIPPGGIFDVRYSSGKIVEDLKSKKIILINSDEYPINIKTVGVNIRVRDMLNGELLNEELSDGEELSITNSKITSIEVSGTLEQEIPSSYQLLQNYPNPFNPSTTIKYQLPVSSKVTLKIYDVLGNEVITLLNEEKEAGVYEVIFNASNYSSGIFFYKLQSRDYFETKKMVLLK